MAVALIPTRPAGRKYSLSKEQQDCLTYYVLMGCTKQEAFLLFFPEFLRYAGTSIVKGTMTKAGEQYCRQFFATAEVLDYIRDYEDTLRRKRKEDDSPLAIEKRKDAALKSLLDKAMSLVESNSDLDADTVKTVVDVFKRLGVLKDDVEVPESPRRYLPQTCSQCSYRSFVESHVETGQIENTCVRCRALDYAKENGFRYSPTDMLREK